MLETVVIVVHLLVALAVVLALTTLHAWVLALEFVLMAWQNRRDPAPRAGWRFVHAGILTRTFSSGSAPALAEARCWHDLKFRPIRP